MISNPRGTRILRIYAFAVALPPVENPEAILRGIITGNGRVSRTGDCNAVLSAQTAREPVSSRPHTPPAEYINPLGKATETTHPFEVIETFKELQPSLEKWLTRELEA